MSVSVCPALHRNCRTTAHWSLIFNNTSSFHRDLSRPAERSREDVDIILAHLKYVKAFERFHYGLLKQISLCCFYECLEKGITCKWKTHTCNSSFYFQFITSFKYGLLVSVYRQGDIGTSWYAVLSGSLDVKVSETSSYQAWQEDSTGLDRTLSTCSLGSAGGF